MTNPPQGPNQPVGPGDPTAPAWPAAAPDQPTEHIPRPAGRDRRRRRSTSRTRVHRAHRRPQEPEEPKSGFLRDPLSIVLTLVIVVALVIAGLLGIELYVRHRADSVVARAVECVVQDKADVSFGMRPFVLQHLTRPLQRHQRRDRGQPDPRSQGHEAQPGARRHQDSRRPPTRPARSARWTPPSRGPATASRRRCRTSSRSSAASSPASTTSPSDGTIELQGGIGTHHRQAGGVQRQPDAAGASASAGWASCCRGRRCSRRWTRSPPR